MDVKKDLGQVVRRQRVLLLIAVVAIVVCVAGLVAVWNIKSPAQQAADMAPPPPSVLTATVKEDILAEQVTLRGVVAADSFSVRPLMALTPAIVTALPKQAGAVVSEGDMIAEISGRPMFILKGLIPAYRDLGPGLTGKDVSQLQAALVRLEYLEPENYREGSFDWVTKMAVTQFYKDQGYSSDCEGSMGTVCLGEVVFVPSLPAALSMVNVGVGDDAGSSVLMTVQLGMLTVTAIIPGGLEAGVVSGLSATISDDLNKRECEGSVTSVGAFTGASTDGSGAASGYPVTIDAKECLDGSWLGLNVRVVIDIATTDGPVLIVSTSAIQMDSDGTTFVQVIDAVGTIRRVDVATGMVSAGEVEIEPELGQPLSEGEMVVTG